MYHNRNVYCVGLSWDYIELGDMRSSNRVRPKPAKGVPLSLSPKMSKYFRVMNYWNLWTTTQTHCWQGKGYTYNIAAMGREKLTCPLKNSGWFKTSLSFWNGPFLGDMFCFRSVVALAESREPIHNQSPDLFMISQALLNKASAASAIVWIHFPFNKLQIEQQLCGWLMCGILYVFCTFFFRHGGCKFYSHCPGHLSRKRFDFHWKSQSESSSSEQVSAFVCVCVWRTGAMMTPGLRCFF